MLQVKSYLLKLQNLVFESRATTGPAANYLVAPERLVPQAWPNLISSVSCCKHVCNAAGAVREGLWVMSLGTSGTLFGATKQPILDPSGGVSPFCSTDGQWLPLLCTMNCTTVTEEVRSGMALTPLSSPFVLSLSDVCHPPFHPRQIFASTSVLCGACCCWLALLLCWSYMTSTEVLVKSQV